MFNIPKDIFRCPNSFRGRREDAIQLLYLQFSETCGLLQVLPLHSSHLLL